MKKRADDNGADLLLVDTGDRVEGNGLYDASNPKGLFYYDLWAEQHVDLICVGNHELYQASTAEREVNTTVPNFKDKYIASNLDYIDPKSGERKPVAQRYRKFKTKNQGLSIVAFGFIFDFTGNANNTVVQPVAEAIQEQWFQDAIREKPDLFLVPGHVGLRMEEFRTIFTAIRKQNWHTPIVFFGGHAHVRDARQFDSQAFAMASGRYFETIGFMSIDGLKKKSTDELSTNASPKVDRKYIDTNLLGMYYHSGKNETTFPTEEGTRVSKHIARARKALDLDHRYGCAPKTLWVSRAKYPSQDSIFSWITDEVFPEVVVNEKRKDKSRLAIMNTGGIRFDIFKGAFTRDSTYLVSPFVNGFKYVPDVPYEVAKKVVNILNSADKIISTDGKEARLMAIPEMMLATDRDEPSVDVEKGEEEEDDDDSRLELRSVDDGELTAGYTTKDDFGTEGDDTVHKAVPSYHVDNCVQSEINFPEEGEPDAVDLVFIDFIQPWVIPALQMAGGDFDSDDVKLYMEGTMTYKMAQWIEKHWGKDC